MRGLGSKKEKRIVVLQAGDVVCGLGVEDWLEVGVSVNLREHIEYTKRAHDMILNFDTYSVLPGR